ncbi:MAG: N-acetylmuramoyl-L-alanine amidase [Bacteroidota bacterium]
MFTNILRAIILLMGLSVSVSAEPYFHEVKARKGDSIYKLMARYQLDNYACNFSKFYELNKLNNESYLLEGSSYFLPVLIYEFNGKTIRSSIGIDSWEQAVRIKDYNEFLLAEKLRRKTIAASRILWVPFHELHCLDKKLQVESVVSMEEDLDSKEEIPVIGNRKIGNRPFKFKETSNHFTVYSEVEGDPVTRQYQKTSRVVKPISGTRNYAIFGQKYAHVPLVDNKLKGEVYYIVSGHGGPDSGAVGKMGRSLLCEDEYAYDVALRLARKLVSHGATAYMVIRDPNDGIRDGSVLKNDTDEYCWGNLKVPRQQKKRLYQRSDMVNALYQKHKNQGVSTQKLVAIHVDSRNKREQTDLFFYHFPGSPDGKKLANSVHRTIKRKYNDLRPGRGYTGTVTARDLHMLRETPVTAVYVELGNIRNSYDRKRLLPASNRQLLADWLYEGIIK